MSFELGLFLLSAQRYETVNIFVSEPFEKYKALII